MKRLLPKSEYAKNSLISVLGVGFATAIPVLLQPILGRIFSPEEFNEMGLYITFVSILAIVANFRYGYAVAIARTDEDAKNLLVGSLVLSLIFAIVFAITLVLFGQFVLVSFRLDPSLARWFYYIPFGIFFTSACFGLNGWLNRKKAFKAMAINKSVRRGFEGFFQICFGKFRLAGGLIYGTFIGDAVNFCVHYFQFKKANGNFDNVNKATVKNSLKEYSDFPKFNLIPSLLDTVTLMLPFLIVNAYYSEEVSGQFYQSRNLLALPLVLISAALSQVLLQRLTENRSTGKRMTPILKRHIYFLTLLGIIGTLIVYPFGEQIFVIFLGDQWQQAGSMSSMMIVAYAMMFIVSPLSVIFFALEKVKVVSGWQFAHFAGISCLFLFSDAKIDDFIFYYVCIEVFFYMIYLALILRVSLRHDKTIH